MKTKFMIVASLGLLFALQSQADPIRAGILMGAGVAIGTINKAKCSFADEKFNAMEVKAPYVNLSTSTINQAKSAPKGTKLKVAGEASYREAGIVEHFIMDEFFLNDKKDMLQVQLSNDVYCGVSPLPVEGEKVYFYGEKNTNGGCKILGTSKSIRASILVL